MAGQRPSNFPRRYSSLCAMDASALAPGRLLQGFLLMDDRAPSGKQRRRPLVRAPFGRPRIHFDLHLKCARSVLQLSDFQASRSSLSDGIGIPLVRDSTNLLVPSSRCRPNIPGAGKTIEYIPTKVNEFQARIREVTRRMMSTVSELSMHQATALKLQQEKMERERALQEAT